MRTLTLLVALLLVALQAQAALLREEAPDHEQPGLQDEDLTISITLNKDSVLQAPVMGEICFCKLFCFPWERHRGRCLRFLKKCCI
ncbi:corticostatin 1-like [Otolemur garnettii]|uniref:corticostatin 1-like n=1 Tax=Otolemur garnettii TaxID=30611 RepID=UPI0006447147|nr:corticostatin 1-like [Otolemur garnettii]